jgi:hypothetical protein
MTYKELKVKALGLIEELNPNHEALTDDPDIQLKLREVINQVMFELIRMKKLPAYVEMEVEKGQLVEFSDIEKVGKYEVYQLNSVRGVEVQFKAQGTVIKAMEDGTLEIDYFKYPERITEKTKDNFELELPNDLLEIAPYGIAGHLLMSDISSNYGQIYSQEYQRMLSQLDPRYSLGSIFITGGVNV